MNLALLNKSANRNLAIILLGMSLALFPGLSNAQDSALEGLSTRIEQDTAKSNELVDYLNDTNDDSETIVIKLDKYHSYFIESRDYLYSLNQTINPAYKDVVQELNHTSQEYVEAIGLISFGLTSDTETQTGTDDLKKAISDRNDAITHYNNIKPVDDVLSLYVILVCFFSFISFWLFLISIRKGSTELENIKAQAKRDLFKSSLWPTIGAIVTATWYYLTPPGGTYFILWGPVLFGAIAFAKSFLHFVFKIRPQINRDIKEERHQRLENLRKEVPLADKKGKSYIGLALLSLILLGGWFYWFQLRPVKIHKYCARYTASAQYSNCIHSQGL